MYSGTYGYGGEDYSGVFGAAVGTFLLLWLVCFVAVLALTVFVFYRVLSKAGYNGWLALLVLVPFGMFGLMLYLAFADWPAIAELRAWRGQGAPQAPTAPVVSAQPPTQSYPIAPPPAPPAPTNSSDE